MGSMKTPVELAISQMQTLHLSTAAGAATRSRSPPASTHCTNEPQDPRPAPSGVTFQRPLVIPSTPSVSVSVPAMLPTPTRRSHPESKAPPWK
ncbi:hypothetical protein CapIbe_006713 [Capra ibex]